jgi:hypothetical protein
MHQLLGGRHLNQVVSIGDIQLIWPQALHGPTKIRKLPPQMPGASTQDRIANSRIDGESIRKRAQVLFELRRLSRRLRRQEYHLRRQIR